MLMGQMVDILIRELKAFDASPARADLLATYGGRVINAEVAAAVVAPLVKAAIAAGVPDFLERFPNDSPSPFGSTKKRSVTWAEDAAEAIHRDSHMNRAKGERTLTPATLDALLVSFVNRAAFPMDLALYTSDLGEGR